MCVCVSEPNLPISPLSGHKTARGPSSAGAAGRHGAFPARGGQGAAAGRAERVWRAAGEKFVLVIVVVVVVVVVAIV